MSTPHLKHTSLAIALVHAVGAPAMAQNADSGMPEIVITGSKPGAASHAGVGGFSDSPLGETPASISVVDHETMRELRIRTSTDALKLDASVSDSYNAVGYAEQFSIRGFNLDNASSYRKDGIAIPGDTQVPLENKERVEVLKGLAGLQAGVASPGGIVNYVIKRPTAAPLRSASVEASERGTLYGTVDLSGRFADQRLGYRLNAALERMRPYVKGAHGARQFVSAAFDWQLTQQAFLQIDVDHQHKSQITAPGYQLIRNESLPTAISPDTLLNEQPWTKPVETRSTNLGLRFEYRFDQDWRASVTLNKHWFKRDDFTAFPYGCSNEGDGYYPGYCGNGDYDVYDYQSVGESKTPFGGRVLVQGKFATGTVRHALTFGTSLFMRSDHFGDYVFDYVGSSNIYRNRTVPPVTNERRTGPVFERRREHERALFAHDIATLSDQLKLHAGLRYVDVKRSEFVGEGIPLARTERGFALPNLALVFSPMQDWNLYGAVAHGLEHGGIAPVGTINHDTALDPARSRQVELGIKGRPTSDIDVSAVLFEIRKGHEFLEPLAETPPGGPTHAYVRKGVATHRGLELAAHGKVGSDLRYSMSAMALDTEQEGTGQADFDGKRVTNVPRFKSTVMLAYSIPGMAGAKVSGAWQYVGRKAFDLANTTMVPAYHLFNFGASCNARVAGMPTVLRAGIDNALDKFYWRDVTPQLGGYLFPGASRTFKLSAQVDF